MEGQADLPACWARIILCFADGTAVLAFAGEMDASIALGQNHLNQNVRAGSTCAVAADVAVVVPFYRSHLEKEGLALYASRMVPTCLS